MYKYFAKGYGGAVYADKSSFTTEIVNSSFIRNKAMSSGGVICVLGKELVTELSSFKHNTAFGTLHHGKDDSVFFTMGGAIMLLLTELEVHTRKYLF